MWRAVRDGQIPRPLHKDATTLVVIDNFDHCVVLVAEPASLAVDQPLSATSLSSSIFLASPNSIRLFSL